MSVTCKVNTNLDCSEIFKYSKHVDLRLCVVLHNVSRELTDLRTVYISRTFLKCIPDTVVSESFLNSMMADFCAAPDCANHASENTYPFCYEHLGQRTRSDPLQQQEGRRSQPSGGANGGWNKYSI